MPTPLASHEPDRKGKTSSGYILKFQQPGEKNSLHERMQAIIPFFVKKEKKKRIHTPGKMSSHFFKDKRT